jgi:hypothetical protein
MELYSGPKMAHGKYGKTKVAGLIDRDSTVFVLNMLAHKLMLGFILATFVMKMVFYFRIEGVIARIFLKMNVSCHYKELSNGILLFRILP